MIAKMFEVRDRGTFIPVLAVKLVPANEAERYLLSRAGYGSRPEHQARYVVLCRIVGEENHGAEFDPDVWQYGSGSSRGTRTLREAHRHIIAYFDTLASGAVVDVEYLLGETKEPKRSEVGR